MSIVPIFVLAGQSNAAFGGIDNKLYELLSNQGGDFDMVKVALGGTSLYPNAYQDWDPSSGELFTNLVNSVKVAQQKVKAAGDTPIVYTLWVQGEQDYRSTTYADHLTDFIGKYRGAIGQLNSTFGISLLRFDCNARTAQLEVASMVSNTFAVETRGATSWDAVHYDKPSREKIALDFFNATGVKVSSAAEYENGLSDATISEHSATIDVNGPELVDYVWNGGSKSISIMTYSGDDNITTGKFGDFIQSGDNNDVVHSGGGNDYVNLGAHDDICYAGAGADIVLGREGNDQIYGSGGDDNLAGGSQEDRLYGGTGNDSVAGGYGRDIVSGGAGADRFIFVAGDFLGCTGTRPDVITDFLASAGDKIALSAVDADIATVGDQAFKWVGTGPFSHHAGELRLSVGVGASKLAGDINGDGAADFWIKLVDVSALHSSSLVL